MLKKAYSVKRSEYRKKSLQRITDRKKLGTLEELASDQFELEYNLLKRKTLLYLGSNALSEA
jgi:hypothetical protein